MIGREIRKFSLSRIKILLQKSSVKPLHVRNHYESIITGYDNLLSHRDKKMDALFQICCSVVRITNTLT